jgi:hypothetical protein
MIKHTERTPSVIEAIKHRSLFGSLPAYPVIDFTQPSTVGNGLIYRHQRDDRDTLNPAGHIKSISDRALDTKVSAQSDDFAINYQRLTRQLSKLDGDLRS